MLKFSIKFRENFENNLQNFGKFWRKMLVNFEKVEEIRQFCYHFPYGMHYVNDEKFEGYFKSYQNCFKNLLEGAFYKKYIKLVRKKKNQFVSVNQKTGLLKKKNNMLKFTVTLSMTAHQRKATSMKEFFLNLLT